MSKTTKPKAKAAKQAQRLALRPLEVPPHSAGAPVGTDLVTADKQESRSTAALCQPEHFATWMRYAEWPLFSGAMLMLRLVPTDQIFSNSFVVLDYLHTFIPQELRQKFSDVYGLSKQALLPEATYRQSPNLFPRAYVKREKYLAWARAQAWLDVPAELQQAGQSRYWMRQDTKEKVTPAQVTTTAKIMSAYANRIDDGEKRLRRMFDLKGGTRTDSDIDPRPLRVVWSDSGDAVRGKYVTELVQKRLDPLCTKDSFDSSAPGVGRKRGIW